MKPNKIIIAVVAILLVASIILPAIMGLEGGY